MASARTILVLLAALPWLPAARAGDASAIQRCEDAAGTAVYTDRSCGALHAQSTPLPDELQLRIAMAEAGNYPAADAPAMHASIPDAGDGSARRAMRMRRPAADGCARSPRQLSRDLVAAFAQRDVNRVAESYHWIGMNHRDAKPVMQRLARLAAQPLADARFLAAWIGSGDTDPADVPGDAGRMQLVFAGDTGAIDFPVRRQSGCYFIALR